MNKAEEVILREVLKALEEAVVRQDWIKAMEHVAKAKVQYFEANPNVERW